MFDYISDRQFDKCTVKNNRIETPGGSYQTIIIPKTTYIPSATVQRLTELARQGITVLFHESYPGRSPGDAEIGGAWPSVGSLIGRQFRWTGHDVIDVGAGKFKIWPGAALGASDGRREIWRGAAKLSFIRRKSYGGHVYFIRNEGSTAFDGWITPTVQWQTATIMDPMNGATGVAESRKKAAGNGLEVRLQLAPGQTIFLKTYADGLAEATPHWEYIQPTAEPKPLAGFWNVEFIAGGPKLPLKGGTEELESWTKLGREEDEAFAGTARYTLKFDAPAGAGAYLLNLGKVADSARVELNGKTVATLIAAPFQCKVELAANNELVVDVTNVAANRIRDLDRRRVPWKIFNDINVVGINYRPLDASRWPVRAAGLLGPVTLLQPVNLIDQE
jgi:hypothetical protein